MLSSFLNKIPKKRLLTYLLILGSLPPFFALAHLYIQKQKLAQVALHLERVRQLALIKEKKEATNNLVRNHYKQADHYFIDKQLETLPLLRKETESLKKISQNETFTKNEWIEKRLHFLCNENKLTFSESSRLSGDKIEEVTEVLTHPVEISSDDLLTILSKVEEKTIGHFQAPLFSPQLIITEFSLNKKKLPDENEVLVLNMKLLKREFL